MSVDSHVPGREQSYIKMNEPADLCTGAAAVAADTSSPFGSSLATGVCAIIRDTTSLTHYYFTTPLQFLVHVTNLLMVPALPKLVELEIVCSLLLADTEVACSCC